MTIVPSNTTDVHDDLDALLAEAGRVLKRSNKQRVEAAMKALQEIMDEIDNQGEKKQSGAEATDDDDTMEESALTSVIPLRERQSQNGRALIRIIQPGWGSSGYYSEALLKRDGPTVFTTGTQVYLNHPTPTEEAERPERDVRDLAGKLLSDARWIDDALYAEVEYYNNHRPLIGAIGEDLDVSIRATGFHRDGEAEGRQGRIIDQLLAVESIDFVTRAGAGGRVARLLEAQPPRVKRGKPTMDELKQLQERLARLEETNDAHKTARQELETALLTERKARLLTEARAFITERLDDSLPVRTQTRLTRELEATIPYSEDGLSLDYTTLKTLVSEAVESAWGELAEAAPSGIIRGMGSTGQRPQEPTVAELTANIEASFVESGMSPEKAKIAATGGYVS